MNPFRGLYILCPFDPNVATRVEEGEIRRGEMSRWVKSIVGRWKEV